MSLPLDSFSYKSKKFTYFLSISYRLFCLQRTVQERVRDCTSRMTDLLDWLSKTERSLGSEQPMTEESRPLTEQYNQHKVSMMCVDCDEDLAMSLFITGVK